MKKRPFRLPQLPIVNLRRRRQAIAGAAMFLRMQGAGECHLAMNPDAPRQPRDSALAAGLLPAIAADVQAGQPQPTGVAGALEGEDDYLDAHDKVDWDLAPFAAMGWVIRRERATERNPNPEPRAWWVWPDAEDGVASLDAPTFDVQIYPGRGMTLRRPGVDDKRVASPGQSVLLP